MPQNIDFFKYYDKNSYIGTFQKGRNVYSNRTINVKKLVDELYNKSPQYDLYFSINNIKPYKNRCVENVISLNWCFADLDIYHEKNDFANFSKQQIIWYIQQELCSNNIIPYPTIIIDSGRGLYLLWKINQSNKYNKESKYALNRWKKVQKELNTRLIELCADVKISTDCSRLLRVPGSYNSKSKTQVTILEETNNQYSLYSLEDFLFGVDNTNEQNVLLEDINEILDCNISSYTKHETRRQIKNNINKYLEKKYGYSSQKQIDYCKAIADELFVLYEPDDFKYAYQVSSFIKTYGPLYKEHKKPQFLPKNNNKNDYSNLYRKRLSIIESLIKSGDDFCGNRENMLFLYRYYSNCLFESKTALENTLKINSYLNKPLSEKEVIKATKSAERYIKKDCILKISKATFCNYVNITEETYDEFSYKTGLFTDKKNKQDIRKKINKKAYEKKITANGKSLKKDAISTRQAQIKKYLSLGYSDKEIQERLKISRATYFRDKKIVLLNTEVKSVSKQICTSICDAKEKIKRYVVEKLKEMRNKKEKYGSLKNSYTLILYVLRTHCEIFSDHEIYLDKFLSFDG